MYYYTAHFLREVGVRTLGVDVQDFPYSKPDEFLELILSATPHYAPREYYEKKDQPPTIFDALDAFADSIVDAIKK